MKITLMGVALFLALAAALPAQAPRVESRLEILTIATGEREVVWSAPTHLEAPNWSRDGKALLFNQGGRMYELPLGNRTPRLIDTGTATRCNNDHGLSPDGARLAISHAPERDSLIYVVAAAGGQPRLVTPNGPSYGMAGRRTARRWPTARGARASTTSTRFRSRAATSVGSPRRRVSTMGPTTRPMGASGSTRCAPAS